VTIPEDPWPGLVALNWVMSSPKDAWQCEVVTTVGIQQVESRAAAHILQYTVTCAEAESPRPGPIIQEVGEWGLPN
jgi:riboflavin synthase